MGTDCQHLKPSYSPRIFRSDVLDIHRTKQSLVSQDVTGASDDRARSSDKKDARPAFSSFVLLALLFTISTMCFLSGSVFGLLVTPVKQDLHLNDIQISMLFGLAPTLVGTIFMFPFAYIADYWNRSVLIGIGVAVWSIALALNAFATGFTWFFVARLAVGLGTAPLYPASYSLLADTFPKKHLGKVMAVYTISAPLGQGLALIIAGTVLQVLRHHSPLLIPYIGFFSPWRTVVLTAGMMSLILGVPLFLFREPVRTALTVSGAATDEAINFVWQRIQLFLPLIIGQALIGSAVYGFTMWSPALFERSYRISPSESAFLLGSAVAIGGVSGMIVGGTVGDRMFASRGKDAYIRMLLYSALFALPFYTLMPLTGSPNVSALLLGVGTFFQCLQAGFPEALINLITPQGLRARILAVDACLISIPIFGLSPIIIAVVSHYWFGEAHINSSMALTAFLELFVAAGALAVARANFTKPVFDNCSSSLMAASFHHKDVDGSN